MEKNYTAKLIVIGDGFPKLYEVTDISPADYFPILPFTFSIDPKNGKWSFVVWDDKDLEFGTSIANAIYGKCVELGLNPC